MIRSPLAAGTLALLFLGVVDPSGAAAQSAPPAEELVDPYAPAEAAPAEGKPAKAAKPAKVEKKAAKKPAAKAAPGAPGPGSEAPIEPPELSAPSAPAPAASSPAASAKSAPATAPSSPAASASPAAPIPAAPATPDPAEAQLAEEIAFSVAARAQELLDNKQYADARQLALEAIARSPRGVAAERAQLILRAANAGLGLPTQEAPPPVAAPVEDPETLPSVPEEKDSAPASDAERALARRHALIHSALYGGVIGAALGSIADDSVEVELGVGAAGAAAGAYFLPRLLTRYNVEQVRTVGSASLWGGVVGGLVADISTGLDGTSPRQVLLGAALGSTVAAAGGLLLARSAPFTRGDVALIDTLAAMGTAGGLTLGLAMQPVESEGYSLNAALGAAAGVALGMVAAPQTDTTPRRALYMAGGAAAGGAAPWLLYLLAADDTTNDDEQIFGLVSTVGLVAGAYLGLRWSRHLAVGLDLHDKRLAVDDAPPALLRRSSLGQLALGGPALRTSTQAPQHAYVLDLFAGRF